MHEDASLSPSSLSYEHQHLISSLQEEKKRSSCTPLKSKVIAIEIPKDRRIMVASTQISKVFKNMKVMCPVEVRRMTQEQLVICTV